MNPAHLKTFKTLKEITGYLKIYEANHDDFRNLSYFSNLETIGGHSLVENSSSLFIKNTSLLSLDLPSLKNIKLGNVNISDNDNLCNVTINWKNINLSEKRIYFRNGTSCCKCNLVKLFIYILFKIS